MKITFKDVSSSDYNLHVKSAGSVMNAEKRVEEGYAIGRDGAYTFEDGYNNKILSFVLAYKGTGGLTERETALRMAANWLRGSGKLLIGYKDGIEYEATVISEVADQLSAWMNKLSVSFSVKPIAQGNADIVVTDASVVSGDGIDFTCAGLYESRPVIKLSGTAASVTLTDGTNSFTYTGLSGDVYIDCDNMVVHDGASPKVNKISGFSGDFPVIENGSNTFAVTGTITNLAVTITYRDKYLA